MKFQGIGIYQILNTTSKKSYIGSTTDLKVRKRDHLSGLRNNRHPNPHIQHSFNKYDEFSFKFLVLLKCPEEDLLLLEQKFFDHYQDTKRWDMLYNICPSANGSRHSASSILKNSLAKQGEKNPLARYTDAQVLRWRKRARKGETRASIAESENVPITGVQLAVSGRTWSHLPGSIPPRTTQKGENGPISKLTEKEALEIRRLADAGKMTQKEIGEIYGVTLFNVSKIKNRRSWKHLPED